MKNITITLEERVAKWVRIRAAIHETSVSRYLGELLRDRMDEESSYERSMKRFLAQRPVELRKRGQRLPSRDERHA